MNSLKKALDLFLDKSTNQEELSDFDRAFRKARTSTSVAGEICILAGFLTIVLSLFYAGYDYVSGFGVFGTQFYIALAISGVPLMAMGTIANNLKKQTALIALQTWHSVPID